MPLATGDHPSILCDGQSVFWPQDIGWTSAEESTTSIMASATAPNGLPICITFLDIDLFWQQYVEYCYDPSLGTAISPIHALLGGTASLRNRITRACRKIAAGEVGPFWFNGHNDIHVVHVWFESLQEQEMRTWLMRRIISAMAMVEPYSVPALDALRLN